MLVFGKAITSRMDCVLQSIAIIRSKPGVYAVCQLRGYKGTMTFVTKCYTPMRGCSALQSMQKMVERRPLRFIELIESSQIQVYWLMGLETHLQDMRKDVILHHCIVYPDRASPDLDTVQNKIVMLATNLLKERSQMSANVPPAILNGRTDSISPLYMACMSCHIGAVNGW